MAASEIGHPYPYRILPVPCPSKEDLKKLDAWNVFEVFRVEALLRSEKVMRLYRKHQAAKKKTPKTDSLLKEHFVNGGWKVLEGFHHQYLVPGSKILELPAGALLFPPSGVIDLKALLLSLVDSNGKEKFVAMYDLILKLLAERDDRRHLFLMIDAARPPQAMWNNTLDDLLSKRHREFIKDATISPPILVFSKKGSYFVIPSYHPRKKPPINGL